MKSNFSFRILRPFILIAFFLLGAQTMVQAQLTITNNTSCTIYIQASQVDNGSGQPCTPCNVSAFVAVQPGRTWVHPGDASCGHYRWLGVRWYTSANGTQAVSYNPIWNNRCGQNVTGARCNGAATTARWNVPSSPGPASISIHGN